MVRNSAPPVALFGCHFQRWSFFHLKKGPNIIIKQKNGSTLQSGTVSKTASGFFFLSDHHALAIGLPKIQPLLQPFVHNNVYFSRLFK